MASFSTGPPDKFYPQCSFCEWRRLKAHAESKGLVAQLRPAPLPDHKFGVNLYAMRPGHIHGQWLRWFAATPVQCTCARMRPLVNRDYAID